MKQPVLQAGCIRIYATLAFVCNFLGLLFSGATTYAQTAAVAQSSSLSYREEMDYMFQPLDKSQVPSGILYDRVFPLADATDFTGTTIRDTTDSEHWFQAFYQFYQARYNNTGRLSSHQVRSAVDASYRPNFLPIGIMRYRYGVLDSLAVDKNLIYVQNGQLYDVAGRTSSPYIAKTIFMATPLYTSGRQYLSLGTTTLKLDPAFIFDNTTAFTAYRVNFNDGRGEQPISANGTVSINYTTPGKRFITIIAYIGTTRYYSKTELNVQGSSSVAYSMAADGICSGPPIAIPITGALPFNASAYGNSESKAAIGKAYLYFAQANCADKKLRKTVVFLDGFDPDNARDHTKIYNGYINIDFGLTDRFRRDGYDLVILDYDDAGDYIERNGLLVIKLLQELKRLYGSTLQQDFVLIGPSMGALVGQYALAEAERRGIAHYTRLFISFDGPHQGANIPIGLQQAVGYAFKSKIVEPSLNCQSGQLAEGAEENALALNVRSAKQMLLHHYLSGSESPAPHPYRTTFVNTMKTLGYPKLCRKVAIINGSKKALNQIAITPTQEILRLRVVKNVGARRGSDLLRWKAFAAPQASRSITLDTYTWKPIAKKLGLQKNYYAYGQPASGRPSLDVVAGVYSNTMAQIAGAAALNSVEVPLVCIRSVLQPYVPGTLIHPFPIPVAFEIINKLKKGRNIKVTTSSPNHCFIPTTSAVDLQVAGSPLVYNFAKLCMLPKGMRNT